ncbi:MAG: ribonuclease HIII [Bacteroidetes bacterium]|nr:ribonuclease HIII [Bacteroidota bacterium]
MSTSLQLSAKNHIQELQKKLVTTNYFVDGIELKLYNYEFIVQHGADKIKVQVYFGKKGLRTVLQGNPNSPFYAKLNDILFEQTSIQFIAEEFAEPDNYIGTDETGKGDYFGPLVTAAFHFENSHREYLKKAGVRDSKELNDIRINEIAHKLMKHFPDKYEIVLIAPEKYNELYVKFKNLNRILTWSHSTAAKNLLSRVECSNIITDKFSNELLHLTGAGKNVESHQIEKGERYLGVAAASILARAAMNTWFDHKKFEGLQLPKGASAEVEKKAKELKKKFGEDFLHKIAKLHFKISNRI